MRIRTASDLSQWAEHVRKREANISIQIKVCGGAGCRAAGAEVLRDALIQAAGEQQRKIEIDFDKCLESDANTFIGMTGCQGLCQAGPLITMNGELLVGVRPKDAADVIRAASGEISMPARLYYRSNPGGTPLKQKSEIPFYAHQELLALKHCGELLPQSLASYVHLGGFTALFNAFQKSPEEVIDIVDASGLRGRGGGGFPTGRKWRSCVDASKAGDNECYIVCNGDEGDPGAFMDCALMEGNPFVVLEGMIIGAYAIGASQGYIYVRNEYPVAVSRLRKAIVMCREAGLLGDNIFDSDFSFNIELVRGGGAFVCGESSALMRSIEGKIGEPTSKYIRSTEQGLFGLPTVLNNVETFACVPFILSESGSRFSKFGTEQSKGTKAFCLAGCVKHTGLVEVPMGTTLRDVIFTIGGGIQNDRPFKAVQTGGPSGGCLPAEKLDLPVDFDELTQVGSMMGSGGMIVMDDRSCMVDVARYFTRFLLGESCGKCVPCREGLYQLHTLLNGISKGIATKRTLDDIELLACEMKKSALCGLGKSAPNPILSALNNFRDEFEEHVNLKRCRAGVCAGLTTFVIDETKCTGCLRCKSGCPVDAISGSANQTHVIDEQRCIRCGACRQVCPDDAVQVAK
ncbi:MAG: 4Fe-4S binding protein [Deltaproteobacteria bacterium]|nr:4Fe-4S binding protein [Deltaproteobacteria bacterium]MBN2671675.1 4Fe-4S binding protein [Deltaproteobacteria bacterium]